MLRMSNTQSLWNFHFGLLLRFDPKRLQKYKMVTVRPNSPKKSDGIVIVKTRGSQEENKSDGKATTFIDDDFINQLLKAPQSMPQTIITQTPPVQTSNAFNEIFKGQICNENFMKTPLFVENTIPTPFELDNSNDITMIETPEQTLFGPNYLQEARNLAGQKKSNIE
jgi:hypothetical protein